MAKKSVDKMTKAELLREVKRLQKQVDKLSKPPNCVNPDSFETVEIEIKHPSEQKPFKITPKFPWDALPNAFEADWRDGFSVRAFEAK